MGWYLTNDMLYYLAAPLLIIPLYLSGSFGNLTGFVPYWLLTLTLQAKNGVFEKPRLFFSFGNLWALPISMTAMAMGHEKSVKNDVQHFIKNTKL